MDVVLSAYNFVEFGSSIVQIFQVKFLHKGKPVSSADIRSIFSGFEMGL